ncbi:MAG: DUF1667 domain-containing protein [Clostridia bacterium]|nr:DUF1667 domain-containing protein [Clostridia bacterium]
MNRELTCIICPLGCNIKVRHENGAVLEVSGNTCPRGKTYAITECTTPMRTLTSSVRCKGGKLLSVKTDRPIPKEKWMEAMAIVNRQHPALPIAVGDVIIEDVFGANIVATKNID